MLYLSKSKYCGLWQCPKIAWMKKYKPEELELDNSVIARMDVGNVVGDLAMGYFGEFVEVTAKNADGSLDLEQMKRKTAECMKNGVENICEASFDYKGLYCAVDILRKTDGGWAIYEVKSSTKHENSTEDRPVYIADVAYQKYVLEHAGVNVTGTYLVCLNKDYVFDGTLDIHKLFLISDVSDEIKPEEAKIEANLSLAEKLLQSNKEPDIDIGVKCKNPYYCGFWKYCSKHIPQPSVFNLYRMPFWKKIDHYKHGRIDYDTLLHSDKVTNGKQLRQMLHYLSEQGDYIEKENIRDFLSTLSFPLYFLDFETIQPVIPEYIGTHPYAQIPFQYSLHYIEREGGPLLHKEFLAESGTDPRRAVAEALCRDIPMNVCVTAYNKTFECTRLKELAEFFPDLSEHLLNIRDNIVDLLVPFQSGYYYNKAMGGSFSIKSVLPALFPDDPELDYHNLDQIHNGGEAMTVFPQIKDMPPEVQEKTRHNLLEYCKLDTLAMVKLWEKLKEVIA